MTPGHRPSDLEETMRFDASEGLLRLEAHLARLASSAQALGFRCDHHAIRNQLQAATFRLRAAAAVRMMLSPSGAVAIAMSALPPAPVGPVPARLLPLPLAADDPRRRHALTDRGGIEEGGGVAVYVDQDGFVAGGAVVDAFIAGGEGLLTPPATRALRPGAFRATLIAEGRAIEQDLRPEDLAGGFLIGDAIHGLVAARIDG